MSKDKTEAIPTDFALPRLPYREGHSGHDMHFPNQFLQRVSYFVP